MLVNFERYRSIYPDNQLIREAMVKIFHSIFQFLTQAAIVFRRGQERAKGIGAITHSISLGVAIKVIWKPFELQFDDVKNQISRSFNAIKDEMDTAEKEHASKERTKQDAERAFQNEERELATKERILRTRDRFRQEATLTVVSKATSARFALDEENRVEKLNAWLAPANVASNHTESTKARHASSGTWFLECTAFQTLLNEDNSFLWVHAIRGFPIPLKLRLMY